MEAWRNDLFDRFYRSWSGIDAAYDKIAAGCGVTSNIMNILTLLYKQRTPMTQNELSHELHLTKQTVTSVLDSLEKRGLVTRSIAEGDRRSRVVALTDEGRVSGRRIGRAMRSVELSAFAMLSDEEQQALVDSMEKLWHGLAQVLENE
ncbi:MarR family winged helix-turn-helix transcriptional regulator [Butyricicoccus sp. Marseille-Q5471]|uniref:MarR family winged helix-turn-helix transcriptional regulator n=1 Tax=Butyricicoccus sp. Marseille-Q5471 TaxID=3039493 RepID=UPI0024BCEA36|nr:MarR family transcriptional regulator [Butyricicoccus sp. Marseille-Q5471]